TGVACGSPGCCSTRIACCPRYDFVSDTPHSSFPGVTWLCGPHCARPGAQPAPQTAAEELADERLRPQLLHHALLRRWASLRAGGRRQEILKPPAVRPAPPAPASDQICWGIHRRRFIPWTASRFLGSGSLASAAVPRASTSAAPTGR